MTIIGITGPTGAGKTTALREVEKLGGTVIDCDAVYHQMLSSDETLQSSLEEAFGPLRDAVGAIDRKRLGNIVFRDPRRLEQLNAIVGRAIARRVEDMVEECRRQGSPLAAIDAIGLLESSLAGLCHVTVAVVAPREVRVARIMAREGISRDYAWSRVLAQKPECYFTDRCDQTLVNDCASQEEFASRARALFQEIMRTRSGCAQ